MSDAKRKHPFVAAIEEGIADLRENRALRSHRVEVAAPPRYTAKQIARIRKQLQVSQTVFASYVGVSPSTIRAWEQAQRIPSPLARRLIQLASRRPEVLRELTRIGA